MADPGPPGDPVEVSLTIAARPSTVFRYFTDPIRFTRWMGIGSVLEAEPGRRLRVGYPTGQVAAGQVVAVEPDRRIVFFWGYEGDGQAAPAGSADQLAPVLGERVADWLAAWNEPDPGRRAGLLGRCLADGGRFRDPTAAVDGAGALAGHIGMVQLMGGGARLVGRGDPEPCHGLVRFGWAAVGPGEVVLGTGTNVAGTDLDGRFRWVTGFWDRPAEPAEPSQPA